MRQAGEQIWNDGPTPSRRPRRLIPVVAGWIAAALLATTTVACGTKSADTTGDVAQGEAAPLAFVQQHAMAASKEVAVPGSERSAMRLLEGKIESTGTDAAGFSLVRVLTTLKIDRGAPVQKGQILCSIRAMSDAGGIARTAAGLPAIYPRPSAAGIDDQVVPELVLVRFPSRDAELAELNLGTDPERFSTARGVKVEWPSSRAGSAQLR